MTTTDRPGGWPNPQGETDMTLPTDFPTPKGTPTIAVHERYGERYTVPPLGWLLNLDLGTYALVRVEDGKAVDPESLRVLLPSGSVLVMRQDGEWPLPDEQTFDYIKDQVFNDQHGANERAWRTLLDALAKDAS